jgi:alpha-N-arabinofuranosidase
VPIFHSRDLVSWTPIGHVLDRPEQLDLDGHGISRGIFAPTIRCHGDTFYVITTLVDTGGTLLVTATDPAGPWSDPIWLPEVDGIDPSIFFDDDGRVWITNNGPPDRAPLYPGHRAIWIQEYDPGARRMVGPRTVLVDGGVDITKHPIWIEGPHLFKVHGLYYLIAAEGGTEENHSEVVFRSRSVRGPYEPYADNPILTQRHLAPDRPHPITSTGHADLLELPDAGWWAVFLGTRPYRDHLFNTGRETFLMPVRWLDGWPVITSGDETVPWLHRRPDLPADPDAAIRAGNFTVREEFDSAGLPLDWNVIRTPRQRWYDLGDPPGWLTLRARPVPLGSPGQPSFVARRQQHAHATASTSMRYDPERPGDRAGMAAFYDDGHFYLLAVTRTADGSPQVRLERRAARSVAAPAGVGADGAVAGSEVVAQAPIPEPAADRIRLRIDARGALYDFSYAIGGGDWVPLARNVDGTVLSTRVAGGFVGVFFGLYAYAGDAAADRGQLPASSSFTAQ